MNWIDVKDQLPRDGEIVLVIHPVLSPLESPLCTSVFNWIFQGIFYRQNGWKVFFSPSNPYNQSPYVTHWMPLPEFPCEKD